jgi:hypothetical protein
MQPRRIAPESGLPCSPHILTTAEQTANSKFLVVGCYASPVANWEALEPEWQAVLERYDIRLINNIRVFRSADFSNPAGPYAHWSQDRRRSFSVDLISVIRERVQFGAACRIVKADYEESFPPNHPISPFEICFSYCIRLICNWPEQFPVRDELAFIAERGTEHSSSILKSYELFCKSNVRDLPFNLGSLQFAEKSLSPLQTADLIAYESYRELERKLEGLSHSRRRILDAVIAQVPHRLIYLDRAQLAPIAAAGLHEFHSLRLG